MCLPVICFPFYLGGDLEGCQRPFHFAFIHRAVQPRLAVMNFVCGKRKQRGVDTIKICVCALCFKAFIHSFLPLHLIPHLAMAIKALRMFVLTPSSLILT